MTTTAVRGKGLDFEDRYLLHTLNVAKLISAQTQFRNVTTYTHTQAGTLCDCALLHSTVLNHANWGKTLM